MARLVTQRQTSRGNTVNTFRSNNGRIRTNRTNLRGKLSSMRSAGSGGSGG